MANPGAEHVRLHPDLVYGNFGPQMSFIDTTPGYSINNYGPTFPSNQTVSQEFTATKNFSFADAKIAVQGIPGAGLFNALN
jgi:hypothetical protein